MLSRLLADASLETWAAGEVVTILEVASLALHPRAVGTMTMEVGERFETLVEVLSLPAHAHVKTLTLLGVDNACLEVLTAQLLSQPREDLTLYLIPYVAISAQNEERLNSLRLAGLHLGPVPANMHDLSHLWSRL